MGGGASYHGLASLVGARPSHFLPPNTRKLAAMEAEAALQAAIAEQEREHTALQALNGNEEGEEADSGAVQPPPAQPAVALAAVS